MEVVQRVINFVIILLLTKYLYVYTEGMFKFNQKTYAKATFAECNLDPSYAQNVSCKLRAKTWEHNVLYVDVHLVQAIRNATVRFETFKYTNQFRPFLINVTFNYCETFKNGRATNPYIQAVLNIVYKYSNLQHGCPFAGYVYVHGAYVDFDVLPFHIPTGTYKLLLTFLDGWPYSRVGSVTYIFKITERNSETNNPKKRLGGRPLSYLGLQAH